MFELVLVWKEPCHCHDTEERVFQKRHVEQFCLSLQGRYLEVGIYEHGAETENEELSNAKVCLLLNAFHLSVSLALNQKDTLHNDHWKLLKVCAGHKLLSLEISHLLL